MDNGRAKTWRNFFRSTSSGRPEKLGAFIGVFTPSILTILGVILYLRVGWVVGNVGLLPTITIVVIANLVTLVTALSVSSVATNMRVGSGGAYYIISRSLGIEVGAAIGIPLYLAMAFSVTLYAFGLAESLQAIWPHIPLRPVAAGTVLVVSLLATRGAGLALRLQLPIMLGIALSLIALFVGAAKSPLDVVPLTDTVADPAQFWAVFAVFFPAVTGIMAGVSLSGDLRRPNRSIPYGTITAVFAGFIVYLVVPIVLAVSATPDELVSNNLIWLDIAGPLAFLVLWGLWGAIFSSAVGSILGAPRTLAAMVDDRILPSAMGRAFGRVRGPGFPLLVTFAISLAAVGLGDLNAVAPVLTMFFLVTYGTINLVAGLETLSGDPSFRPTLGVPWWLSIAGALACFFVMFLISPLALAAALVFEVGVYLYIRRKALTAPWGDLRRGALMALIRSTALQLRRLPEDPRNWRPNILLFANDAEQNSDLVRFGSWLVQDRGILTVAKLAVGSIEEQAPKVPDELAIIEASLEELGVPAFAEVDIVEELESGILSVAQSNGIAGIESNTVMFGWSEKTERRLAILRSVEQLAVLSRSAVICRILPRTWEEGHRLVHVWWGGLQNNGDMLVLFAHLLAQNPRWRNTRIVINSIATNEMTYTRNKDLLESMIRAARIDAEVNVILKPSDRDVQEIIWEQSEPADVVLLGLRSNKPGEEVEYAERMSELVSGLPSVIFVRNAGIFRGQLLGETQDEQKATLEES